MKDILKDQVLFIADGHHRYQTSINYSKGMSEKTNNFSDDAPFNYRMVVLANMFDALSTVNIDFVYKAVVEFIKWYNENKK